jgi:hypothetical protein
MSNKRPRLSHERSGVTFHTPPDSPQTTLEDSEESSSTSEIIDWLKMNLPIFLDDALERFFIAKGKQEIQKK